MSKLKTPICSRLGIEWPIFGFAHSVDVVSAVSAQGGLGCLEVLETRRKKLPMR